MKLYHHEISSNSRKVCALAKHLELDVDYVLVDLTKGVHRTPEFLTINPNGKLPTMVDAGRTLWESNAILCYLAKKAGSEMWPADDEQKIDAIKWMTWEQALGICCVCRGHSQQERDEPAWMWKMLIITLLMKW